MTVASWSIAPELAQYLHAIGPSEPNILKRLRERNEGHRLGKMSLAPEQAQLLVWLAKLTGVKRYLELGVFTGYSSTAMALALPEDGRIVACDLNASFTALAQEAWQEAGVSDKIQLRLQPALFSLEELLDEGMAGTFDMAFIDADKAPTPEYVDLCLQLVRDGGIIAIDNVLLGGRVLQDADEHSPPSVAILQQFNRNMPQDPRYMAITLPVGDGMTLLIKHPQG
ncbi:class I SAM-dependent methyltransferase [Vitreoscilla stercoraria]|uniref:Class I SAM-dependent methyltransferase n=1 Tax=Vitreoscilla stercoraria TaxID=61 RepID=A0ABY4E7Y1_VITST|nr:class I SAM-dependent methyltransferase [Vitreoscilla stercoraria]UOO91861.1 class I SAM-dependent methyltransferase [Vitreoscilla stercoraria]